MSPSEFKRIRKALGLSQSGLALLFGVSDGRTVRRWEHGERHIPGPAARLLLIAHEFPAAFESLKRGEHG